MREPDSSPDVTLADVTKRYGSVVGVERLSLDIPQGQFLSLLGPSGCGKTTLLRLIAGFERPSQGEVFIRGERVTGLPAYRRNFGMVFQSYALFPHLTVAENIAFGLKVRRAARDDRTTRIRDALALVKLTGLQDRYPRELSGGQQQRVALARAIAIRPAVLLLDEPLAALDKKLRDEMRIELRQLHNQLGMTTVFVTHDQEEALTMSDRVAVMNGGRIQQIGTPRDIYERPQTEFVATFMGTSNILSGRVVEVSGACALVDFGIGRFEVEGAGAGIGSEIRVTLRPERVRVERQPGAAGVPATVADVVYIGNATQLHLRCGPFALAALFANDRPDAAPLQPGEAVRCHWTRDSLIPLRGAE